MLWNKAKCLLGRHERDGRLAVFDGDVFVSQCKHCATPMAKDFERGWIATAFAGAARGDPTNQALFSPADGGLSGRANAD
ncbi:hypothetical protein G4G27_12625 [Sphingomonas sp. So64.6b]|uniref:hypothetical protein n=1 Tax=Sphingomonas sp. So64.6b TaxID=2997354 RepID=UPI001603A7F8|nr:hypothetical protein [Sphingomonas sp. So64.6b]QNA84741.1 hypothetical protein G4G27_12625 [Sphingomonas sp. So64.6b]